MISLKCISLFVLVVQTSGLVLVLRYSRMHPAEDGNKYLSSTAIVLSEIVKICICLGMVIHQSGSISRAIVVLKMDILRQPKESLKLTVPAVLYVVQNNLIFLALSNLSAATYQVTYQLKILTTALFMVSMLGKKLSPHQWGAMLLLTLGVALVQWPSDSNSNSSDTETSRSATLGLAAVLGACMSSGFAGVYFEKLLKGSTISLWVRNICLAGYSIVLALLGTVFTDLDAIQARGFFQGYNTTVWVVVVMQAVTGIIIAVVVKYADNILKGFANAVSILLSAFISIFFMHDLELSTLFLLGSATVIAATVLYAWKPAAPKNE